MRARARRGGRGRAVDRSRRRDLRSESHVRRGRARRPRAEQAARRARQARAAHAGGGRRLVAAAAASSAAAAASAAAASAAAAAAADASQRRRRGGAACRDAAAAGAPRRAADAAGEGAVGVWRFASRDGITRREQGGVVSVGFVVGVDEFPGLTHMHHMAFAGRRAADMVARDARARLGRRVPQGLAAARRGRRPRAAARRWPRDVVQVGQGPHGHVRHVRAGRGRTC